MKVILSLWGRGFRNKIRKAFLTFPYFSNYVKSGISVKYIPKDNDTPNGWVGEGRN